jgi:uncharacterized protein (TIGR03086 family)
MVETQRYFTQAAKGEEAAPPSKMPPDLVNDDAASQLESGSAELIGAFGESGVIERTGPMLGIAFADQLVHGWDIAKVTDQDATMPSGLAEAALEVIDGRLTEENRKGAFKPAITVPSTASAQERLLAYTGRHPGT